MDPFPTCLQHHKGIWFRLWDVHESLSSRARNGNVPLGSYRLVPGAFNLSAVPALVAFRANSFQGELKSPLTPTPHLHPQLYILTNLFAFSKL